jgi:hypothetical protein
MDIKIVYVLTWIFWHHLHVLFCAWNDAWYSWSNLAIPFASSSSSFHKHERAQGLAVWTHHNNRVRSEWRKYRDLWSADAFASSVHATVKRTTPITQGAWQCPNLDVEASQLLHPRSNFTRAWTRRPTGREERGPICLSQLRSLTNQDVTLMPITPIISCDVSLSRFFTFIISS